MSVATRLDVWHGSSAPADWNRMIPMSFINRVCQPCYASGRAALLPDSAPGNNAVMYDSVRQPQLSDTEG